MIEPPRYTLAFDLDGVVLRTTMPKHDAMLSLFPDSLKRIASGAILGMGGVPRTKKLSRVHEVCFGRVPTDAELHAYLQRYQMALQSVTEHPVVTPGIKRFLESSPARSFVCSSAPEEEVTQQIRAIGLAQYFERWYGEPVSKRQALQDVMQVAGESPLIFFGDAEVDREAAALVGCAFVAVVGETDQFSDSSLPRIIDFEDQQAVLLAMNRALMANSA